MCIIVSYMYVHFAVDYCLLLAQGIERVCVSVEAMVLGYYACKDVWDITVDEELLCQN